MDSYKFNFERKGVFLCLRSDKEKIRSKADDEIIIHSLKQYEYKYFDMYSDKYPNDNNRLGIVEEKFKEFARAELVITDRLHGMICCAITETPCIVLSNNHHKVRGVYEWIKDLPYVEYIESTDDIEEAVKKVISVDKRHYDNRRFLSYYEKLAETIREG